jgi:hypothetical protein
VNTVCRQYQHQHALTPQSISPAVLTLTTIAAVHVAAIAKARSALRGRGSAGEDMGDQRRAEALLCKHRVRDIATMPNLTGDFPGSWRDTSAARFMVPITRAFAGWPIARQCRSFGSAPPGLPASRRLSSF